MSNILTVDLGERSYPICVDGGLLSGLGEACRSAGLSGKCLLVTDDRVDGFYGEAAEQSLDQAGCSVTRAVVPAGEASKCGEQLFALYDAALEAGLDRSGFVVALGGGVVGDLTGYLAASYLRGIRFVQVPTSLLAMVDSAVGGKTGINLPSGKNLVGAFYQPQCVQVDLDSLNTLPPREYASGLAEVVKYGVIWDAELFDFLEQNVENVLNLDRAAVQHLVLRSCAIKAEVVRQDEREAGLRAILNFGHTLAHAIENRSGYGVWLHGEAVAAGMVYAARVSEQVLGFPRESTERLMALLEACKLPVTWPGGTWADVAAVMARDKKASGGQALFVLAKSIGEVQAGMAVPSELLEEVWHAGYN